MNRALEVHDSTLASISWSGSDLVLSFAPAYVHQSAGLPGVDAGFGSLQDVDMTIAAAVCDALPCMPCRLTDGRLFRSDCSWDNLIPLPLIHSGPISFVAVTEGGDQFIIRGTHASLVAHGEANWVEDFPG